MTTQPEALRLADLIRSRYGNDINDDAAAELRRLHEVNQELLEALEEAIELFVVASTGGGVNFWMAAKDLRKIHNKATGYEE